MTVAGTLAPGGETSCCIRKSVSKADRDPFVHSSNLRACRSETSTDFVRAAEPRVRHCERALPYRLREVRKSHQRKKKARTERLRPNQKSTSRSLHTHEPPRTNTQTRHMFEVSPRREKRCGDRRCAEEKLTSSSVERSMAAVSVSARSPTSTRVS